MKNEEVQVSVYCTAYNHEKYIRQALESFINQKTNFRYEIIVHDDASTDDTPNIIMEYADRYPDLIVPILQPQNVTSQGRDKLKEFIYPKARGRYIASCEGDDFWIDENKLQCQYDALESHPECSFSVHKVIACKENGDYDNRTWPPSKYDISESCVISQEELLKMLLLKKSNMFHTSSRFCRKELLVCDYDKGGKWCTRDIFLMLALATTGGIYYISDAMSCRRMGTIGNWNSRMDKRGLEGWYQLYNRDFHAYQEFDKDTDYKYHSLVAAKLFRSSMDWMSYKPLEVRHMLIDYRIKLKDILPVLSTKLGIVYTGAFIVVLIFPWGFQLLKTNRPVQK